MSRYVEQRGHGEVAMMPPGLVSGARVTLFPIRIEPDRLQRRVDQGLNAASGGAVSYRVLGSWILLCFLDAPKLTSPHEPIGYLPDRECAIWVPLFEHRRGHRGGRLAMWMPYLFVDSDIAMATGREVWGFQKSIATLETPGDPGSSGFTLTTRIFPTFSPDTEGVPAPLIRVRTAGPAAPSMWSDLEEAARGMLSHLGVSLKIAVEGTEVVLDLLEMALTRRIPVVNLQQFRDAADPTLACYQAIIGSDLEVTAFRGGGLLGGTHSVTVIDCASHDLIGDLGLPGADFEAGAGLWVEMDFLALPGSEIRA
jgi:hypothetical protein